MPRWVGECVRGSVSVCVGGWFVRLGWEDVCLCVCVRVNGKGGWW